jgi:ABC-type multidrug transport system fused ATPase/permease subunit
LDNRVIVSGFNMKIPAREKIAICERSGSGKSTVTMGLMRIAKKIQGRMTIDGIEITERPLSQLRKFICVIHQDVALISGTLRSNLDPMSQFTDHQLWSILEKLDLKEVAAESLETEVVDSGANLTPCLS